MRISPSHSIFSKAALKVCFFPALASLQVFFSGFGGFDFWGVFCLLFVFCCCFVLFLILFWGFGLGFLFVCWGRGLLLVFFGVLFVWFGFFQSALLKQQECCLALSQPELSKQGKISVQIYGKVLGVKIWFGEFKAGSSPETTLLLWVWREREEGGRRIIKTTQAGD